MGDNMLAVGVVGAAVFAAIVLAVGLGAVWSCRRASAVASGWSRRAGREAVSFAGRVRAALESRPGLLRAA